MISDIESYFAKGCGRCAKFDTPECSTRIWADALARLRALCLDAGLSEHVKWGHPCYMHAGRNIAIIGAFRDNLRLSFFNASLMKDPADILQRQGPNTEHADMIRFTSADQVEQQAAAITAYLHEAMGYADAGIRPARSTRQIDLPDELIEALDADPELAEAFAALTPGRKKGYALHIGSAKNANTRTNRIEKLRPRIFAGKGYNER